MWLHLRVQVINEILPFVLYLEKSVCPDPWGIGALGDFATALSFFNPAFGGSRRYQDRRRIRVRVVVGPVRLARYA